MEISSRRAFSFLWQAKALDWCCRFLAEDPKNSRQYGHWSGGKQVEDNMMMIHTIMDYSHQEPPPPLGCGFREPRTTAAKQQFGEIFLFYVLNPFKLKLEVDAEVLKRNVSRDRRMATKAKESESTRSEPAPNSDISAPARAFPSGLDTAMGYNFHQEHQNPYGMWGPELQSHVLWDDNSQNPRFRNLDSAFYGAQMNEPIITTGSSDATQRESDTRELPVISAETPNVNKGQNNLQGPVAIPQTQTLSGNVASHPDIQNSGQSTSYPDVDLDTALSGSITSTPSPAHRSGNRPPLTKWTTQSTKKAPVRVSESVPRSQLQEGPPAMLPSV
ncbi:hypothetical protein FISHEDRAFT_57201 [Fistulina hepatica ATCC 64428]|nr:hypothetical protein FISHEDRAFT_57201 [Fistulina hepatica ATCC 64428]